MPIKDPEARAAYKRQWAEKNRDRLRIKNTEYQKVWRASNRDKCAASSRKHYVKKVYGLSLAEVDAMHAAQNSRCAICGREAKLHIDHCHDSGRVRGLLCSNCNTGAGLFGHDPATLLKAVAYLKVS